MAQAETVATTNPLHDLTMRQLHAAYDAAEAAIAALQGIINQPRTTMDGLAASHWIETELEKFEQIVEDQIIPLALARAEGGEEHNEERLDILLDYAALVEDRALDREVVAGLLRRIDRLARYHDGETKPELAAADRRTSTERPAQTVAADCGVDRPALAAKAHQAALAAQGLICALRGAEERSPRVTEDVRTADYMGLAALTEALRDKIEDVADTLHG